MTRKLVLGLGLLVALSTGRATAQTGNIWVPAKCDLKPGHFLVNSGILYLKNATQTRFDEQRLKDLGEAQRVLTQALTSGGQEQNPSAWYYYARYHYIQKDAIGADSAFTRAERLKPECQDDIDTWRRFLWVPTLNAGIQAWQAGNTDSAITMLRQANAIYRAEPNGFIYLAILYANSDQVDSAAKYFKAGIEIAGKDTAWAKDRREATFNLARVYHRAQRWDDAIQAYQAYLALAPRDAEATAGLASVYGAVGKTDSARALYTAVLERADSVEALDLFQAGVAIFQGVPEEPDTTKIASDCRTRERGATPRPTVRQIATKCGAEAASAWKAYDAEAVAIYRMAARAFEAGLVKNPSYRDAIFNVTNTYFAVRDSARMLAWAQKLLAIDPLNRGTIRLVAQAWHMRGKGDSAYKYLVLADSLLDIEIAVSNFQPEDSAATLSGLATNLKSKASTPGKVTFEFVNAKGELVTAQPVDLPVLQPEANHQFELKAMGQGIVAWRYRKGG